MIVCTVSPTIDAGTVVRWYRTVAAAEQRWPMIAADRYGVTKGAHLTNGEVPPEVVASAELAHATLRDDPKADLSGWATHRREWSGFLVPVVRAEAEATGG